MPEENPQIDTGVKKEEPLSGPNHEAQVKRLREERDTERQRVKELEEKVDKLGKRANQEESYFENSDIDEEREAFYQEKAESRAVKEAEQELAKLPEKIRKKVEADPFNKLWTDKRTLEFELYDCDNPKDPKQAYEASVRAFKKSLPKIVEEFGEEQIGQESEPKGVGNNPALGTNKNLTDPWQIVEQMEREKLNK